jgi:sec-independent protein translocase protein TatA
MLLANFLSPTDLLIVGVVALLLFGNRLPSVARSLGRSLVEFKKGMNEGQDPSLEDRSKQ